MAARAIHQPWTKAIYDAFKQNLDYLTTAGADLAAVGASNTLAIAAEFHRVTLGASWLVDNISDVAGLTPGQPLRLYFVNAGLIRNNGGGAGNIRTLSGGDRGVLAGEIVTLTYEATGAVWREQGPTPGLVKFWDSVEAGVSLPAALVTSPTLPTNFKHLLVEMSLAPTVDAATQDVCVRFNGDTANNYRWNRVKAGGVTVTGQTDGGAVGLMRVGESPRTGGDVGEVSMKVTDYRATKAGVSGTFFVLDGGAIENGAFGGRYANGPITSVSFLISSGANMVAPSRFTIYLEP